MKPTVHYNNLLLSVIALGRGALVAPVDHPNHLASHAVSNTKHVLTSRVIKVHYDGSFETENTIYKPQKEKSYAEVCTHPSSQYRRNSCL